VTNGWIAAGLVLARCAGLAAAGDPIQDIISGRSSQTLQPPLADGYRLRAKGSVNWPAPYWRTARIDTAPASRCATGVWQSGQRFSTRWCY